MGVLGHSRTILGAATKEVPIFSLDRPNSILVQAAADPVFDADILPLTYTNSRWMAFIYEADMAALKRIVPAPLEVVDPAVEFWYVDHNNTMLGPYFEFGVTVACHYKAPDGTVYKAGYYPYMYLSQDSAIFAGREPFGFPKKRAHFSILEHGGGYHRGELPPAKQPAKFFSVFMERRGWLIHQATGTYDMKPVKPPVFYGDPEYGRFNMKLTTSPDVTKTEWALTYLPSLLEGEHRFQLRRDSITTASPDAIETWFMQGTPFDNVGAMIPPKVMRGLISFNFDLIIPPAKTVWTKTVTRTADDIKKHLLFGEPYKYYMRHDFPMPRGV